MPDPAPQCPACEWPLKRSRRSRAERQEFAGKQRRWRCTRAGCGWAGLLPLAAPGPAARIPAITLPGIRRRGLQGLVLAATGVGAAVVTAWLLRAPPPETVMVGHHVVHRGTHLEGERLPPSHPLTALLPAQALEQEPQGYTEAPGALLRVRRHCAWGLPGRNPYRGSAVQALQTATLSPTVVQKIAADIHAGRRVDRVHISNAVVRAVKSGREFDPHRVAMTYGMTLCADTRINFVAGHSEGGDLYEAMDDDGRIYAVMVPDVCGNVSVLGQRYVAEPAPSAAASPASTATGGASAETSAAGSDPTSGAGSAVGSVPGAGRGAAPGSGSGPGPGATRTGGAADPRPWMRLPPEQRIRQLPDGLRYNDRASALGGDRDGNQARAVPEAGSLWLGGLALAVLWLVRRTGQRR